MKRPSAIATGLLLAAQTALWIVWWHHDPLVSEENGPMEAFQALAMLAGVGVLAWAAVGGETPARRIFPGSLALFYATLVLGEIDTRPVGSPLVALVFDGAGRDVLLAGLWAALGIAFLRHRAAAWRLLRRWITTGAGALLLIAGLFWLVSGAIDKLKLFPGTHHFHEELPETSAAILMLLAAIATARSGHRQPPATGPSSTTAPGVLAAGTGPQAMPREPASGRRGGTRTQVEPTVVEGDD